MGVSVSVCVGEIQTLAIHDLVGYTVDRMTIALCALGCVLEHCTTIPLVENTNNSLGQLGQLGKPWHGGPRIGTERP